MLSLVKEVIYHHIIFNKYIESMELVANKEEVSKVINDLYSEALTID